VTERDLSVEAFSWGRVDVEGRLAVRPAHRGIEVAHLLSGEARWRFTGGGLYALGQGGTLLFPTPEGTLRPGAFVSVGLGLERAR
jgi:hypothetical protein